MQADRQAMTRFVSVLVPIPGLEDATFTYLAPDEIEVGERVEVALGWRAVIGYVIGIAPPHEKARPINGRCDGFPVFTPEMIELTRWLAASTFAPWYRAMECAAPGGLKMSRGVAPKKRRVLVPGPRRLDEKPSRRRKAPFVALNDSHTLLTDAVGEAAAPPFATMEGSRRCVATPRGPHDGNCRLGRSADSDLVDERLLTAVRFVEDHPESVGVAELARRLEIDRGPLDRLVRRGVLAVREIQERRDPFRDRPAPPDTPPELTSEQVAALAAIESARPGEEFLLFGVTGSGKTEIYLRAIAGLLAAGRGAIVLVPEISLTPQSVARFRARFGATVAVLHSALSPGERLDEWSRIRRGEARVVIGARSAVFAPVTNLGIIVIDEAHEGSYKQGEAPRYHTLDVARRRVAAENATLVLGTATPTVEMHHVAVLGVNGEDRPVTTLRLARRIADRPMPAITVVDMRRELADGHRSIFSRTLIRAIDGVLERGEQAILFLNRRGHDAFFLCRACGEAIRCPRCAVSLTGHRLARPGRDRLVCHQCDHRIPAPSVCPSCGSNQIKPFGAGTERVEAEVVKRWPAARVLRMDADTTVKKDAHRLLFESFADRRHDILVGTQMIGKGIDLPGVTLVGAIAAESSLHLPDFRAAERTFSLLVQVAGRAGRAGLAGRAVFQTYSPDHPAIRLAAAQDVERFLKEELRSRQAGGLPPFSRIIQWTLEAESAEAARDAAERIAAVLEKEPGLLLGPAPAPIERRRGRHRWQVRWLAPVDLAEETFHSVVARGREASGKTARLIVDRDPIDLL
jgi:primosomal protein N' (replication factor Y)